MNIVIWGTGANASEFINKILPVCKDELGIKIVGILDDCEAREGSFFHGFKVQHPSHLDPDGSIDHVVQLETYGGLDKSESRKLLPGELSKKLITIIGFFRLVNSCGFWRNKTVLFIGGKDEYYGYAYGAAYIFKKQIFISDINEFDGEIKEFDFIFCCGKWYSSAEQSKKEGNSIRKEVLKKYDYDSNKILNSEIWGRFLYSGNCWINTNGNDNPDKKFFILTFDRFIGWGVALSLFGQHLSFARENGLIPVADLKHYKTQYCTDEEFGSINVWNNYYKPLSGYSLEEVYNSKNVYLCGKFFDLEEDVDFRGLEYSDEVRESVESNEWDVFADKNKKVLGVIYRGTDFASAYNHPKIVAIEDHIQNVRQFMNETGYEYIYLATEVEEAVDLFKTEFGDKVYYISQQRYNSNERRLLATISEGDDKFKKGADYLSVLHNLTMCDSLYGPDCGALRYARLFRNDYEYVRMQNGARNRNMVYEMNDLIKKLVRKTMRTLKLGEYKEA